MKQNKAQTNSNNIKRHYFATVSISLFTIVFLTSLTQSFINPNLLSSSVSAIESSASANASVTVSSACSFSRTNGSGEYNGVLANNSSVEIPASTFTTFCNDPGGYAIYAVGYSNNTFGNTDLIFDNTPDSSNNIKTDGNTIVGGNGSYWGMSLSASVSGKPIIESGFNDSNNPHTIPSTYTKIASYNTTTAGLNPNTNQEELLGQDITVTYSATASSTQPAGTYTGAVKYTMVHPSIAGGNPYIVIFDSNGGTGDMNAQAILPDMATPLATNTFVPPTNKAFGGWCTTNTTNCADGTLYINEQAVTNLTTAGGEITLYAMWYYAMQDIATWGNTLNIEDTVLALDKRDYKTYYVTKLQDDHIWMTQNLAIDLSYVDGAGNVVMRTFTSEDTDLNAIYDSSTGKYTEYGGDGYTIGSNNIISWTPKETAITSTIRGTSAPNWANSSVYPYSANKVDGSSTGHESLGNYYNWTVAIASNDSSALTSSTYGNVTSNPKNSICPKGWRLPTISNQANTLPGSTNEFGRLNQLYNDGATSGIGFGTKLMEAPLWFVWSGYVRDTSLNYYRSYGRYWSSTVVNSNNAYGLRFSADIVNQTYNGTRSYGWSVRCIAR